MINYFYRQNNFILIAYNYNLSSNITYCKYFFVRFTIVAKDDHSGVPIVKLKIVTKDGTTKYEHTYENIPMVRF